MVCFLIVSLRCCRKVMVFFRALLYYSYMGIV
jgi:hypothetical protein